MDKIVVDGPVTKYRHVDGRLVRVLKVHESGDAFIRYIGEVPPRKLPGKPAPVDTSTDTVTPAQLTER